MKFKKLYSLYGLLLIVSLEHVASLSLYNKEPLHRDYEEIKKRGVLRIVTEYNSPDIT